MKNMCFLICLLFSNNLFAQVALEKGQPAPETGVFLTKEEAAKVIAEKRAIEQVCRINQETAVEIEKNKCEHEKSLLKNEITYQKNKFEEINKLRDAQENRLYETISDSGNNLYWFVGGLAVGATVTAATTIGIILTINK